MNSSAPLTWLQANRSRNLDRLLTFLRFPTISAQPAHTVDMLACADWLRGQFAEAGIAAEILETAGHPAVFAEAGPQDAGVTVLVYGHYDVQPTGDERLWHSPPFEPTLRNGAIYARGSADDKGQLFTHLLAAEAWLQSNGALPIRVKYLIEGEEEIGSRNLPELLRRHKERLACDYVALSDTAKLDSDTPALTCSTRGLVYKQVDITGPQKDLHSGIYGGIVDNPINVLAAILASLKDGDRRVTIPGFYDAVQSLSPAQREAIARSAFDEAACRAETGCPALAGEKDYSAAERLGVRPTLDVNGICGGYTGEGASTVIPSKAFAKVSMRLVADQDPAVISKAFDAAVLAAAPPTVRVEVRTLSQCPAYSCPTDSPGSLAALEAMRQGYGREAGFLREGGSLPILPLFREVLGADSLMLGFCARDCGAHSANEYFHVADLEAGSRTAAIFLAELARRVR